MAITKLFRIKERPRGDPGGRLHATLRYICNPEKSAVIGGSAGRDAESAYAVMKRNKDYWYKTDGSQGFHYIISFPPECGVTPEKAASVAEDFMEELLGGKYLFLYSVHTDHAHMHVHIVFDSVSAEDGIKFHSPKGDWERRIQPISDRVCKRYGLPELEYGEKRVGVSYGEWKAKRQRDSETSGKAEGGRSPFPLSWYDLIRDDIDEAILRSPSLGSFLKYLGSLEYTVRDGKYLSVRPKGRERAVRTHRLGKGYSKEEIEERIAYVRSHPVSPDDFRVYGDMETVRRRLFVKKQKNKRWHMNAYQRAFYRRWRNTCFIRKPDLWGRPGSRAIVLSLEELSENLQFLIREDIRSEDELKKKLSELGNERKAARSELSSIKTRLYRTDICRLVAQREKLMEKFWRSADEEEELDRLDAEIEKIMPVGKAVKYRNSLMEKKAACLSQMRDIRERGRLLRNIGWQFEDEQSGALTRGDYREVRRQHEEEMKRRDQAKQRNQEEPEKVQAEQSPQKEEVRR